MQQKIENFALLKQHKPSKFKFSKLGETVSLRVMFFLEFTDFFLEVREVGRKVAEGSVLGMVLLLLLEEKFW